MKKKIILIAIFITGFCLFLPNVSATTLIKCGYMSDSEGVPAKIVNITNLFVKLIKYLVPVIIVIVGSIGFFKSATSSDSDMLAKAFKSFSKKLIAGALVFLIVTIFQTVISMVAKDGGTMECISCFISNKGCSEPYEEKSEEPSGTPVEGVENNGEYSDTPSGENTISDEQIKSKLGFIPPNLTVTRRKVLTVALSAVDRIPYYYGGAATVAGFDGNNFGTKVPADYKGRTKKGLDCSHFVDWVFWTATGDNLGNGTTTTLWDASTNISKSELKTGDLGFKENKTATGTKNHVGIYAGNGLWIHENGTANNVSLGDYSSFKYFRRIIQY